MAPAHDKSVVRGRLCISKEDRQGDRTENTSPQRRQSSIDTGESTRSGMRALLLSHEPLDRTNHPRTKGVGDAASLPLRKKILGKLCQISSAKNSEIKRLAIDQKQIVISPD